MYKSEKEVRDVLITKAGEDADFRVALLADPKAVIRKEFNLELPDSIEIQVHESDLNTYHLSLPPQNLTAEQLEAIVGGSPGGSTGWS